ncbi:phage tail protein [Streptococcus uberis]|uniref:phage tail protein n=1 Tax=Streptococcus uberis TaxID=1349 RepID=UPI00215034A1|nr:phage tail protein [Streptococcus uberis]MCR4258231.1 phage tail protein [Streptococcus uberis]
MQITFYDKNMHETAVADNALLNAIKINKASLTSFFEEATHQVEFEFSKESGEWWGIKENGYLAFRFLGDFFRFSIVKFKENAKSKTISIIGDYFNLEMLSENCLAYEKQPARTIVEHLTAMEFFPYANFEIGVNELATSKKTLKYEGEDVKYKRLISIINNFGGECEFEIKQKRNGQFDKLILNIYKANDGVNYQGVGRNRRDFEITIDNSNDVSRTFDMTDIKTAIEPIGKDGLRLGNRGTVWKNEQGQTEFYQKNNRIYAPIAAENMPKVLDIDDYLLWKLNIDTDDVAKLESEGLKWLKNVCYGKETIEVTGSFDVRVGDTVILNHKGIGRYGILGSLRVMKITWNLLTGTNEVTFSNFKRLASKISAQGLALQDTIESPASYDIAFNTTDGTVFKNNTGVSTVSFNFFKNGTQTAVLGQRWYNSTQLLSNGLEVTIKPDMLTDGKLNLRLEVDVTDAITFSKELTFINVNDGINGSNGRGITSTEDYYLVSASKTGITSATTGWVKGTPQVATATNKYHWHYHVDIYSDGTRKETVPAVIGIYGDQGLKGADGKDGSSSYTHVAYANKSTDVLVDAMTTFAVPSSFSGSTLTSTKISGGYKFTSTGGNSYTKQVVGFNGTTGKNVYTYLVIKNTHATNDIVVSFNGIGEVLNENFSNVTVKPGQTYVDYRPAICRDTYNFLQISIGSTAISNDLSYEIYDYALYNTNPFINFSLDVNPNCRFRGEYQDNNQTASTDPTKYKWSDLRGTVDVGGRNYLTKSNPIRDAGANKLNALSVRDAETPNGFKVTGNQTKDGTIRIYNVINSDGWWTVSFDIKGSQSLAVNVDVDICGQGVTKVLTNSTNTYERKSVSVNVTNYSKNPSVYHFVDFSNFSFAYFWIDNIQIEKGNVATDYEQATEDIDAKIDSNQALTQAQMLALEERSALARDNAIAEAMKNTISEVEAKWQTWYNLNTADEKQKVANDIASLFERVAEFKENLGEASAKFSFINNETLIGEEGVAIGDKEGKAKLFLSNDSISFVTNGVAQMTLTGDTLTIKNGLFTERIQIGNYVEEVYDRNPLYNIIRPIKYS